MQIIQLQEKEYYELEAANNGCFWYGHRGCTKYVEPKTNAGFWKEKIARNIAKQQADGACYPLYGYDIRPMRFVTHSITKLRG